MILTYVFLILAQVMVAISTVSLKYLISSMPMLFLLGIRFSLATLLLLPLHYATERQKNPLIYLKLLNKKDWLFILAQALSAGVLFNALMLLGLNYTNANIAGIIMSILPALIGILSFLILKEKLSVKKSLSIGLATLGLLTISFSEFNISGATHSFLGDFIIFLALLPEAGYYILSKLHTNKLPVFLIAALINGINAIILLPFVLLYTHWSTLHCSAMQWFVLIIASMASGLFYVFWYSGSHKTDVITASLSTALMPIATVSIAWLVLGEMVNATQLTGMGLVIASIIAYTFS